MVNLVAAGDGLAVRSAFPHAVRVVEHFWLPLADGTRLAARMWLPEDAAARPVPAIVEYIPYRQRDFTLPRDELIHPFFAGHGYAAIRIDTRGAGNSDGLPMDEYVAAEQDDMVEALAWIARQAWCSGQIGMIGISWGGFSALQTAARRPPQLKAIVALCASDDRFHGDVHYMSGCLLRNNLAWGGQALAYAARAPDPEIVGDGWRRMWRRRLEALPFVTAEWLRHQRRDGYWRHGSVAEDFGAIRCPVFYVSGWADGYTDAGLRLMAGLQVPRRCLIGPWGHGYPHLARPGPAIGFLQEALRWWDRWLKGRANGIEREPMLRLWLQDDAPPRPHHEHRPGRWIAVPAWPWPGAPSLSLGLKAGGGRGRLVAGAGGGRAELATELTVGMAAGEWNPHGIGPELAGDQRQDDARSMLLDGAPLPAPLAIVGAPRLRLTLACDRPLATLVARLQSVAPSGASASVTWGCLNLAHRQGSAAPQPLQPGRRYRVEVTMNAIAQRLPAGQRLRLALACGSWPLLWPAPQPATLALELADARLELPLCGAEAPGVLAEFEAPAIPAPPAIAWLRPFARQRRFVTDLASDRCELVLEKDDGAFRIEGHGMEIDQSGRERQSIVAGAPLSNRGEAAWRIRQQRGGWQTEVEAKKVLTCERDRFRLEARLTAREGGAVFFRRRWRRAIPRDLM